MYCIGDTVEVEMKGLRAPATVAGILYADSPEEQLMLVVTVASKYVKRMNPEIIKEPASCEKNTA